MVFSRESKCAMLRGRMYVLPMARGRQPASLKELHELLIVLRWDSDSLSSSSQAFSIVVSGRMHIWGHVGVISVDLSPGRLLDLCLHTSNPPRNSMPHRPGRGSHHCSLSVSTAVGIRSIIQSSMLEVSQDSVGLSEDTVPVLGLNLHVGPGPSSPQVPCHTAHHDGNLAVPPSGPLPLCLGHRTGRLAAAYYTLPNDGRYIVLVCS